MMVNFSLHQVICSVLFVALNLLMLPFAYMKTILAKTRLARAGAIRVSDVILYVIIGIPLLLLLQIPDLYDFLVWSLDQKDFGKKSQTTISKAQFLAFYEFLQQIDEEGQAITARELVKRVFAQMKIS